MKLSIVIIGDEILLGQVTDTNSGFLARTLGPDGWQVQSVATVPDDARAITRAITRALTESDLVITTGGLGPTRDDITKGVLLDIFGGELRHDPEVEATVRSEFERRHLPINDLTLGQAMVPSSCRVIQNRYGTAPVMWFEREGRVLISMPGVPFETEGMMTGGGVAEMIRRRFAPDVALEHHTLMVAGISESALAQRLAPFEESLPRELHLAYLPQPGLIRLRLDGHGTDAAALGEAFSKALQRLRTELGDLLIHDGDATPAEILLEAMRRCGYTLATAESCTGGNIAHSITRVAGCSDVFRGSVVSYCNEVKTDVLGVPADTLQRHGAVSEPTIIAMAEGARRVLGADCAIATSGIAGPGGAVPGKPVGTVWTAIATPEGTTTRLLQLAGSRSRIIDRATTETLLHLARILGEQPRT